MSGRATNAALVALLASLDEMQTLHEKREATEERFQAFAARFPLPVQRVRTPEEIAARKARKAKRKAARK